MGTDFKRTKIVNIFSRSLGLIVIDFKSVNFKNIC